MDFLSFGTMNTSQNRFFWRGAYSAGTIYNAYDVVSYLGAAYIALATQTGVIPTTTGSWDQMTSAGAVTSVAGRVGNVVLSAADLSNGLTGTGAVVLAASPTLTGIVNTGNVIVNPSATGTGAALTVGGTSTTTGGISVFIGAFGSQNERLSVVPGDGASAAVRVGALSVRTPSAGFLTGSEVASISSAGIVSASGYQIAGAAASGKVLRGNGTSFVSATLAAADLSNGVTGTGAVVLAASPTLTTPNIGAAIASSIQQVSSVQFAVLDALGIGHFAISNVSPYQNTFVSGNGGGSVFLGSGAKTSVADTTGNITMSGSTSGTTVIQASAAASGTLTLPAATDTLVGRATTDTLTNKTLTAPKIGGETISAAPRMTWGIDFIANMNNTSGVFKQMVLDKAITITRIDIVYAGTTGAGSTTPAKLRITDGTTNTDVSNTNGAASDTSGAISVNYAAGATLQIKTVAGVGYTTNPTNVVATVQYKMQ